MGNGLLTPEEVLLLENIMYMAGDPLVDVRDYQNKSVGDLIHDITKKELDSSKEYSTYTTGEEWSRIIQAVENNDTLMNMQIAATNTDNASGGGGGVSAVFTSPDTGEAVVAFRGTAEREWKDDFVGGGGTDAADGVSTPQQENALDWYQSVYDELGLDGYTVTVTGHSKGGNKAKYITLLDESVDRCISFDGQGFSDEFIEYYSQEIANRQDIIENHNVDYDYVNILLNDVGNKTYYEGQDYGEGGILEAHCPNTLLKFDEDGNCILVPALDGQAVEMQQLDAFLNSYLRSLSSEEKQDVLSMIGKLVEGGFSDEAGMDFFLEVLLKPKNQEHASYLIAYLLEYEQANPEFADSIENILKEFGMGDIAEIVDVAQGIIHGWYFDLLLNAVLGTAGIIPDWLWNMLSDWLYEEHGIRLSREEMKKLLNVVVLASDKMHDIKIQPESGADKEIVSVNSSSGQGIGRGNWSVYPQNMERYAENLSACCDGMRQVQDEIRQIMQQLQGENQRFKPVLSHILQKVEKHTNAEKSMKNALNEIAGFYNTAETNIVNYGK